MNAECVSCHRKRLKVIFWIQVPNTDASCPLRYLPIAGSANAGKALVMSD
jgi:hypothetical protein